MTILRTLTAAVSVAGLLFFASTPASANADDGDLTVSPASGLFDVTLIPGVPEQRMVQLSNVSPHSLLVQLTASLAGDVTGGHRFDDLRLHATPASSCAAVPVEHHRLVAFSAANRLHQAVIDAGTDESLCLTVLLPASASPADSTTTVDLRFHAVVRPDGELPQTGWGDTHLLAIAFLALFVGMLLALTRKRARDTATSDAVVVTPSDPTESTLR